MVLSLQKVGHVWWIFFGWTNLVQPLKFFRVTPISPITILTRLNSEGVLVHFSSHDFGLLSNICKHSIF